MSANPHWEVVLGRTPDLSPIDLLPYAFSFTPIFNRPGSFTMTLPLDDPIAYKIAKHATCVSCERNQNVKWSGSIVSVNRDPAAMTLSFTAIGWLDEFNHRHARPSEEASLIFSDVIGGNIVQSIVSIANAQTSTSGTVWPTHMTLDASQIHDTQVRTRSYKRSQNYGQAIQELVDIENGLDIRVDPLTREISTYPPTFFVDRTKAVFGYGIEPFNLLNAPQSDDGTNTADRVSADGLGGIIAADDDEAIATNGGAMRESWISLPNVSSAATVAAYVNAELVYQRFGTVTYDLKPDPYGDDVLRLYDDFELGDKVYLAVDAGALQVDHQAIRVFSVTIDVDAQGNEVISQIGVAPQ